MPSGEHSSWPESLDSFHEKLHQSHQIVIFSDPEAFFCHLQHAKFDDVFNKIVNFYIFRLFCWNILMSQ